MEYTIQQLAKIAGISTRTLRYYDEIELLKPARINSSGYRIYGEKEINRLQQILFYRELGVGLETIKEIITNPTFAELDALKHHLEKLLEKKEQIDLLIKNVNKTIANKEGRIPMTNEEKFEGFKKKVVANNEAKYGKEIREKYGEATVEASNQKLLNMSESEYEEVTALANLVNETLKEAMTTGDPASELGQKVAEFHKKWLSYYWPSYTKAAHAGLAQMYVDDDRFKAYYENIQPGAAQFLRDAIHIYTGTAPTKDQNQNN